MLESAGESTIASDAEKWFISGTWKKGLSLDADTTTNIITFYRQYHANKSGWNQAFAFLKDQDLETMPPGKYAIDEENVYAFVTEGANSAADEIAWESHRKYNDIQFVIKGEESIGITDASKATIVTNYDENRDITFYHAESSTYSFRPGVFFIFFPQDIHQPGIKVEGCELVKKIVIKVRTAI